MLNVTYSDNITSSYSTDGSTANQTDNYTVFYRGISNVPVASSHPFNTTFKTGILWDMGDGGTAYSNTTRQNLVFIAKANSSAVDDVFGSYNYLVEIPYTLSTHKAGNDLVAIYAELR